jgi:uncharacterized protein YndB with AHSA1/START domain
VDPFTVEVIIDRPREEVFEYLADIANHAEFTDHYLVDWRLTREDSYGVGAGARFRITAPLNRFPWADATLTEVDPPRRIVERGRTGKFNRILTLGIYELEPGPGGTTRVRFSLETLPKLPTDRFLEKFGARGWMRRKTAKAMRRLRSILEEDLDRGERVTVAAGGPRKPASGFRFRPTVDR